MIYPEGTMTVVTIVVIIGIIIGILGMTGKMKWKTSETIMFVITAIITSMTVIGIICTELSEIM